MNIETERKKLELQKVSTAKMEMAFKIMELEVTINRIKSDMDVQQKRIDQLNEEIKGVIL